MYDRLDTILACDIQMDRQTDGKTSYHSIVCTMHTRRAVKTFVTIINLALSTHKSLVPFGFVLCKVAELL